jgi:hypothetical protein
VTKEKRVESFNGTPMNVTEGGTSVDLKYDQVVSSSSANKSIAFNFQRGLAVSGFEGTILEKFYQNVTGISTISLWNKAIETNVSIFFITNDTMDRLDNVSIPQGDKDIIISLINSSTSFFAIVPNGSIQIGSWSGVGYAIIDAESGAGKYLISGGLEGGVVDKVTGKVKSGFCGVLTITENIELIILIFALACAGSAAVIVGTRAPHPALVAAVLTTCSAARYLILQYEKVPEDPTGGLIYGDLIKQAKDQVGCG